MSFGKRLYQIWVWFCFIVVFLLIYPFFVLFSLRDSWKKYGHFFNKVWAHTVFASCMLRTKVEFRFKQNKKQSYVYCANHSSYLDIPTLCYSLSGYYLFIGKASLTKVPLFGYMFRNYYIAVDRHKKLSKYATMQKSMEAIDKKRSLAFFPEGTIPKNAGYNMIPFKEGAFRIAIEKQVPIVPVTIPFNWLILPDDGKYVPNRRLMKVIVHEPIETKGLTLDDIDRLKDMTFNIIQKELILQNESVHSV